MKTLFIDTSSNQETVVGLRIDGKEVLEKKALGQRKSQAVLPMIDELLKKHNLDLSDFESIEVNQGPGSFTGLRVGLAIANSLSKELGIPINGKKPGTILDALYS